MHFIRSLIVGLLVLPAFGAPVFQLRDLGLPPGISQASDLNDNGVVVGVVVEGTNATIFTSRDGVATRFTGPGVSAGPNAINNQDQIVGSFNPPPTINEFGDPYWHLQAWTRSNGITVLLGSNAPPTSEAFGINDRGDIVGYIGSKAYILSAPPTSMTENDSWGGSPPPAEILFAINNDRIIVGTKGTAAFRWRGFDPDSGEHLDQGASVRSINSLGQSVGRGGYKLSGMQPTLWNGTNVTFLGAPLNLTEALDINDVGSIVGTFHWYEPPIGFSDYQPHSRAVLWTNNLGVDLNSITQLPEAARLVSAVAINKSGLIAANLWLDGTNHAALLEPTTEQLGIGQAHFTQPVPGIQPSNSVTAAVSIANWAHAVSEVTYTLHRRWLVPGYHFDWDYIPPRWLSYAFRTNISSTLNTTFTNLPAGQYALAATVVDTRGTRVFLAPTFFTVTEPARLVPLRFNWRNELEYGFAGGAGFTYVVEESADLVIWTEITNTHGTLGGAFRASTTNHPAKYFRSRVIGSDPEHFGTALPNSALPGSIAGETMSFFAGNGFFYRMTFHAETVQIEEPPDLFTGTYTYELRSGRGIVNISIAAPFPRKIDLAFEISFNASDFGFDNHWRSTEFALGERIERSGRFQRENVQPPVPPIPQ